MTTYHERSYLGGIDVRHSWGRHSKTHVNMISEHIGKQLRITLERNVNYVDRRYARKYLKSKVCCCRITRRPASQLPRLCSCQSDKLLYGLYAETGSCRKNQMARDRSRDRSEVTCGIVTQGTIDRGIDGKVVCCSPKRSVYPSGGDLATMEAPIAPLAPGRFSTTTGWPIVLENFSASSLAR